MREILFRGKLTDDSKWVYGCLLDKIYGAVPAIMSEQSVDDSFNLEFEYDHVQEKTVGQYTGMKDKNGKRIFEGDIIELFAQGESEHPDFGYIEYDEQSFAWRVCWQKYDPDWLDGMQSQYITVIGNVFDNKDLLS